MINYRLGSLLSIPLLLLLCNVHIVLADEASALQDYQRGNSAYQKKDYEKAIELYSSALSGGMTAASLEFNLGNAYFKSGQYAKAILHYERAQRLNPSDEDIAFNLRMASSKTVDKIDVMPEIFYKRWINGLVNTFTERTWSSLCILFVWVLFGSLLFYFVSGAVSTKKIAFLTAVISLVISGILFGVSKAAKSHQFDSRAAVVMSASAYVKSSPDEKGNDILILHEGTKIFLLDELGEWKKIRLANGTVGWINTDAIETI